jgi:hypothetical protein
VWERQAYLGRWLPGQSVAGGELVRLNNTVNTRCTSCCFQQPSHTLHTLQVAALVYHHIVLFEDSPLACLFNFDYPVRLVRGFASGLPLFNFDYLVRGLASGLPLVSISLLPKPTHSLCAVLIQVSSPLVEHTLLHLSHALLLSVACPRELTSPIGPIPHSLNPRQIRHKSMLNQPTQLHTHRS